MVDQPTVFGVQLRRLRLAAGLSLAELARRVHYSKGYLGKIETGDKPAGRDLARRCDAALHAGGRLSGLVPTQPEPAQPAGIDGGGEVWVMSLAPDGASCLVPMNRRDALAAGAVSLLGLGLSGHAMPAAAAQQTTIVAFRSLLEQSRRLGQIMSPSAVLPTVIAQTNTLRGLAASAGSDTRDQLLQLAARFAEYAGWMTQEAGDDRGARWWTRLAVDMATAAGDTELATYSLIRHALITLYRDDATDTVGLARQAQATMSVPARIRGLAALREAQGHALAGDDNACWRALDRAAELLPASEPSADGFIIGSSTVPDLCAVVTGWCLHDLGRPAEAAEVLDREVAAIPCTAGRSHIRFGVRRALAHAAAGEVDHACELTHDVLRGVELVDSATIRLDLRRLARALARWHTHPPVRELLTPLTAALHVPSAMTGR